MEGGERGRDEKTRLLNESRLIYECLTWHEGAKEHEGEETLRFYFSKLKTATTTYTDRAVELHRYLVHSFWLGGHFSPKHLSFIFRGPLQAHKGTHTHVYKHTLISLSAVAVIYREGAGKWKDGSGQPVLTLDEKTHRSRRGIQAIKTHTHTLTHTGASILFFCNEYCDMKKHMHAHTQLTAASTEHRS